MPITIAKDAGAGAGSDSTLTIRNFENLVADASTPADVIGDLVDTESAAILIKFLGATLVIDFDYTIMEEATDVVSGSGSGVTTAPGQFKYLYDTLMSKGASAILDTYTLTLDFGGGVTFVRTGVITKITCTMTGQEPLTFKGHITFQVGTVA